MENLGPPCPSGSESDSSGIYGMSWHIWENPTDNPNGLDGQIRGQVGE